MIDRIVTTFFLLVIAAASVADLNPPLGLTVDSRFAIMGSTITFTLTGPPDTEYFLHSSPTPSEVEIEGWGTLFLDPLERTEIAHDFLSPTGTATAVVPVPSNPEFEGALFNFQARGISGADQGVSNAITVRINSAPASGARRPEAMAVTPNGEKAYVAHEEDGTVSVIDAVNDALLYDVPVSSIPPSLGLRKVVAIDPEGRHAFVTNPQLGHITVIHTATDAVSALIPVPAGIGGISFDFSGTDKIVYASSERLNSILRAIEAPDGTFSIVGTIPLGGTGPGPIAILPSGLVAVAHRQSHELEVIDPTAPPGSTTVALTPLGGPPLDLVLTSSALFVPTFTRTPGAGDGRNEVLEVDLTTFQVIGAHLVDHGTDYFDGDASAQHLAVVSSGSGSLVVADALTLTLQDVVDLAPGEPTTTPHQASFVPSASGPAQKLYVINHFRETVRPVDLSSGPPFPRLPEITLAHSGQPRVPLIDLSPVEDGEWFFSSVEFFNGNASNPNPTTCATCHPRTFSGGMVNDNGLQAQALFDMGSTGPWLHSGAAADLEAKTQIVFNVHGTLGGTLSPIALARLVEFQSSGTELPISPFLLPDGSLSVPAQNGKVIFEGVGGCSSCHAEPGFIPQAPDPMTIENGVGTGLAPANVPSLRGLWTSSPYLHDGSAPRLMDILDNNVGDLHGNTSGLTLQERTELIKYLLTL